MNQLEIKNLSAEIEGKEILQGLNLNLPQGEVHAVMGPNGSGKSTLSKALSGHEDYEVTSGSALLDGEEILGLEPEEIARLGLFLAFQYPVEIPGVNNATFMRTAVNAVRVSRGEEELSAMAFLKEARTKLQQLKMNEDVLSRQVNVGFSGGEKKRNEILQMAMLEPRLAVLDETDSGLDIDALKIVADGINRLRDGDRAMLVITHYQRLLEYIVPDHVHVLANGRIVRSGDKNLAKELEKNGYAEFSKDG